MQDRWLVHCLAYLFLLFPAGCQALHSYRPLAVQIKDAETGQPIPQAEVCLHYPQSNPNLAPWNSTGLTDADGVAHLRAAAYGELGLQVQVKAPGYLAEEKWLSTETIKALEPAHLFESVEQRPVSLTLTAYAEPHPSVELVVPAGYRGLVKVSLKVQDDIPNPPHQRCFRYEVPASGVVQAAGPPLLRRVTPALYSLQFADGVPVSRSAKDSEVGFWWLKAEDGFDHFYVGAKYEFDEFRHNLMGEMAARQLSAQQQGKGGGHGRRNHGGNNN
jgi:hypothetical protein